MSKLRVVHEFWEFTRTNKKYWLVPILIVFLLLAVLLGVAAASGPLSPFIYTLF